MIDQLIRRIKELNNPTVVGLDPRQNLIPTHLMEEGFKIHGKNCKGVAWAYEEFNCQIIDAIYDIVPAIKPQIAFYEELGIDGLIAYKNTIKYAKEKGMIVIGDIKRSDIASSAIAYANAHLGEVDVDGNIENGANEDFSTVNPYLGSDSLEPFIEICDEHKKGIFVLVKTSNEKSGDLQDLVAEGKPVYEHVADMVEDLGKPSIGKYGYSNVGAVVGATHKDEAKRIREVMPHTFFLVPGYGAQGGTAEDLSVCFDENGLGAIVNSSRGIISAYQKDSWEKGEEEFAAAAREAALSMRDDITSHIATV